MYRKAVISKMGPKPHENGERSAPTRPSLRSQAAVRANRTKRLKAANKPFELLDDLVEAVVDRMDLGEDHDDHLDRNVGRAMLQGLALRKDLELAKDRRIEVHMKLEGVDVRAELERLKDDLGLS